MSARFEIVETDAEQPWHVRLIAENGEPISTGENHTRADAARRAVEVEAELFGYQVLTWDHLGVALVHEETGWSMHLPVTYVDEAGNTP
jgi:uncharacterized protein YegP (UPF0339 family)